MEKLNLTSVEETLFVPMRGRVYTSENFPEILNDKKALEISKKLPESYMNMEKESQYTLMASGIRSMNIDRYITKFLTKNPCGTVINIGCGMETTFYRHDNNKAVWYEIDLEEVTNLRKKVFEENSRDIVLTYSMFDYNWIKKVKKSEGPYLIVASGVFYYFEEKAVIEFFKKVKELGNVEIVFDTVSKFGMKQTRKYMKQLGKDDALMYFYVEDINDLLKKLGNEAQLLDNHDYYKWVTDKRKFNFMTKMSMIISDKFHMVKMIHLKL